MGGFQVLTSAIIVSGKAGQGLVDMVEACLTLVPPVEVIVADTGCEDEAKKKLAERAGTELRLKIVDCGVGTSFGAAVDSAIKKVRGKFLLFLAAESSFDPSMIEKFYNYEANIKPPFAIGGLVLDSKGQPDPACWMPVWRPETYVVSHCKLQKYFDKYFKNQKVKAPVLPVAPPEKYEVVPSVSPDFMFIPTESFKEGGAFDSAYQHAMQGVDFGCRFARMGGVIYLDPELVLKRSKDFEDENPEKEAGVALIHYFHEQFGHSYSQLALWAVDSFIVCQLGFRWCLRKSWAFLGGKPNNFNDFVTKMLKADWGKLFGIAAQKQNVKKKTEAKVVKTKAGKAKN